MKQKPDAKQTNAKSIDKQSKKSLESKLDTPTEDVSAQKKIGNKASVKQSEEIKSQVKSLESMFEEDESHVEKVI